MVATACGCWSVSLKTLSITDSSVLVVSSPQKAHQSFTTIPAERTSLPRFTVPACVSGEGGREDVVRSTRRRKRNYSHISLLSHPLMLSTGIESSYSEEILVHKFNMLGLTTSGTCNNEESSSWSSILVFG